MTIGKAEDKEVDFVAQNGSKKMYIQVAYLLSSQDTVEREFGAYDAIRDNYPKFLLTLDEDPDDKFLLSSEMRS